MSKRRKHKAASKEARRRHRAYNRTRFLTREARARAAKRERLKKKWTAQLKKVAVVLAALMQLHGQPNLEVWVADRLLREQEKATSIHRKLLSGGCGRIAIKKKKRLESP
jgi:hypothetical protein